LAALMQTNGCGCFGAPPFYRIGLFHALKPCIVKVSSVRLSISPSGWRPSCFATTH